MSPSTYLGKLFLGARSRIGPGLLREKTSLLYWRPFTRSNINACKESWAARSLPRNGCRVAFLIAAGAWDCWLVVMIRECKSFKLPILLICSLDVRDIAMLHGLFQATSRLYRLWRRPQFEISVLSCQSAKMRSSIPIPDLGSYIYFGFSNFVRW